MSKITLTDCQLDEAHIRAFRESMSEQPELKPCPFMGHTVSVEEMRYANIDEVYGYRIACCCVEMERRLCGWKQGQRDEALAEIRAELVSAWNRRAQSAKTEKAASE